MKPLIPTWLLPVASSIAVAWLACATPAAETVSGKDRDFFENKIRPVLVNHCYECHSQQSPELGGKLLLDSRAGIAAGGQSGPVLVAGQPGNSLLIDALRYDGVEMPPENPLPPAVIADFETWVRRGAPDPRTEAGTAITDSAPDLDALWSFIPRRKVSVPDVRRIDWPQDALDCFVLARLEAADLQPTRDAPPRTLIRRLYYDLIGLPPDAAAIDEFTDECARDRARAIRRLVDRLLERPQFGERWGRHWLDVARYGESNGDDGLGRNASFPHAWRYRDYVIDSLNSDVPYDRFITEQIAGDLLPAESAEQRNRHLVATGFLAIGPKPAAAMNKNFAMDVVDDQINVVGSAIMGLSVACARCHDHKHDPVPTRDYYALAGIFSSTQSLYGLAGNEKLTAPPTELHTLKSRLSSDSDRQQTPRFSSAYRDQIAALKPVVHAPLDQADQNLSTDAPVSYSGDDFATVKDTQLAGRLGKSQEAYSISFWFKNDTPNNSRPITAYLFSRAKLGDQTLPGDHLGIGGTHDNSRSGKLFVFNGNVAKTSIAGTTVIPPKSWNHVTLIRDQGFVRVFLNGVLEIESKLKATFADSPEFCLASRSDKFAPLTGNVAHFSIFDRALSKEEAVSIHAASGQARGTRTLGFAMGVRDKDKPANCKIHIAGESGKLGAEVDRGFLTGYRKFVSTPTVNAKRDAIAPDQSGRLQLAAWLTRPNHPQTARVIVNRIWLHLFGQGIVSTPDDFGVYGARPSHPLLLDHLADRFVREGWSIKRLIRAIVLSRTYQLDSVASQELVAADPDHVLLTRHRRRRLDAESLRDSMLAAAGTLDLRPAGQSAIAAVDALINWPPGESSNLHRDSQHRSIYLCMLRHAPPPELAAFDLPDGMSVMGQREETILPGQSLFLINSPFVVAQSESLATAILAVTLDEQQRIKLMFRRILQRDPSDQECDRTLAQLGSMENLLQPQIAESGRRKLKAWAGICQALMATNEFRYVD